MVILCFSCWFCALLENEILLQNTKGQENKKTGLSVRFWKMLFSFSHGNVFKWNSASWINGDWFRQISSAPDRGIFRKLQNSFAFVCLRIPFDMHFDVVKLNIFDIFAAKKMNNHRRLYAYLKKLRCACSHAIYPYLCWIPESAKHTIPFWHYS